MIILLSTLGLYFDCPESLLAPARSTDLQLMACSMEEKPKLTLHTMTHSWFTL